MKAEELFKEFNQKYGGYVCIDESICQQFLDEFPERLHTADYLYDWVLSQDLAYEVIE